MVCLSQSAAEWAHEHFHSGCFFDELSSLIAVRSESTVPGSEPFLQIYLETKLVPAFREIGFHTQIFQNPAERAGPFLIAERIEDPALPTILLYGHGDVVPGQVDQWSPGLSPWKMTRSGDRLYGRGIADSKGQHWINICALRARIETHGKLGFNCRFLIEMMEETGSPGLEFFCRQNAEKLAADLFIASDGPRLSVDIPTIFLGNRGISHFSIKVKLRENACHSGNWGGILVDPGIVLSRAISTIIDQNGQICVPEWRPPVPSDEVRKLIAECPVVDKNTETSVDAWWGEKGLSPAERLLGWNCFTVLAISLGDTNRPMSAIAPEAHALCQLRFVEGTNEDDILPALERFFKRQGITGVELQLLQGGKASRLRPDHPAIDLVTKSVEHHTGKKPHIMPNFGGNVPNTVFHDTLGLPTIWLPHGYRNCNQHAPDENLPLSLLEESLQMMTGLFGDLADSRQLADVCKAPLKLEETDS